jgi:hypothetical protein
MSVGKELLDPLIIEAFCKKHHVRKLSLFGSAIRADAGPESDLDILDEFEEGHAPGLAFFAMERELSQLLGRRVDLNTMGFLGRSFRDRVVAEAKVCYALR